MVSMLQKVQEPMDEKAISSELAYMLHIRKFGKEYVRDVSSSIEKQLGDLMNNYPAFQFNPRVLVVLIETGYIQ
jgi:hypothetical protein